MKTDGMICVREIAKAPDRKTGRLRPPMVGMKTQGCNTALSFGHLKGKHGKV